MALLPNLENEMKPILISIQALAPTGYIAWVYARDKNERVLMETIEAPTWGVLQDHIRVAGYWYVPEEYDPRPFDRECIQEYLNLRARKSIEHARKVGLSPVMAAPYGVLEKE